jgi:hypothetical protein
LDIHAKIGHIIFGEDRMTAIKIKNFVSIHLS